MGAERTHPKLVKKGWRPAAMGPLCRAVTDTKKAPMPATQVGNKGKGPWRPGLALTVLGAKNGSVGTDWQSQKGGKGSWGQETASPRGRPGPTNTQRIQRVWWEQGQTEEERNVHGEKNTQNLRHQTDKEVAIWGRRNTEEAPREASRHTSESSSPCLAHGEALRKHLLPGVAR